MATDPKNATSPFGFVSGTNPLNNVRDRLNAIANSSTGDDPIGYSTTGSISEGDLIVTIGEVGESAIVIDSIQGTLKLDADVELIDTSFTIYDRDPSTGNANFSELGYSGFEIRRRDTGNKRASYDENRIVFGDSTNDSFQTRITPSAIAATINISLPSESGQFALTSEIPSIVAGTGIAVNYVGEEATISATGGGGGGSGGTELIDEGNGNGLVIAGRTAGNYGNVGLNAVDLSTSSIVSTTNGATGQSSTVSGGENNIASDSYSTISGGEGNTASGEGSTISGGYANTASSSYSTVSGGYQNTASSTYSTVSGGYNTASGNYSTISGGYQNTASGGYGANISGGQFNTASGDYYPTVGGGNNNTASGYTSSTVSGGNGNTASGYGSTVTGGRANTASGNYSTAGGQSNTAGDGETVFGQYATAGTARAFAIGAGTGGTPSNVFEVYKSGGIVLSPTTQPGETIEGMMYYDSATNKIKFYNGTAWVEIATV